MLTKKFHIEGMCCDHCVTNIKGALEAISQVSDFQVQADYPQATVQLKTPFSGKQISEAINNAGHYTATEIKEEAVNS